MKMIFYELVSLVMHFVGLLIELKLGIYLIKFERFILFLFGLSNYRFS